MLKVVVPMAASILATEFVMAQTEIVGNVDSKCIIISETPGVYGNPNPYNLQQHLRMEECSLLFDMTYWPQTITKL